MLKTRRGNTETKHDWNFCNNSTNTENNEDIILFADNTSIEIKILNCVKFKLHAYDESARKMGLSINWAKVKNTDKKGKQAKEIIKTLPSPHGKMKAEDNAKILGNLTTTNNNTYKTINDRLNKAKTAWGSIKKYIKKRF